MQLANRFMIPAGLAAALLLGLTAWMAVVLAQGDHSLPWAAQSGGGGESASSSYRLAGSVVPAAAGKSQSPGYVLEGGFSPGPGQLRLPRQAHPGDLDGDGVIGAGDVLLLTRSLGTTPAHDGWNPALDFVQDGRLDILDLAWLARLFGIRV